LDLHETENKIASSSRTSGGPARRSTSPAVSVVMPVHNALPYLDEAIESILSQTYSDFEFVILDDASTDGSAERLAEWAERDPRIRLISAEYNLGPALSLVRTSLDEPELRLARSFSYSNYDVVLHNKYSGATDEVRGRFDFIVDNNPTSACCCLHHLAELFRFLELKLAEGGQIVTDRVGLAWIPEDANPRWSFDFDDLQAVGSVVGLKLSRINRNTYVLSRGVPAKPAFHGRLQALLRTARRIAIRARQSAYRRVRP